MMSDRSLLFKRLFDIGLASFGFVIFFPFAVLFGFMIYLEDRGPVLYIQRRWGKGGKKFIAYKFRTMVVGAGSENKIIPAEEDDPRFTKVGKFLRATAMDELPQLINIFKGDMSFVGPRAFASNELSPTMPGFQRRHQVSPGLTGPAQIYLKRDATFEEKFVYDFQYIENQSFLRDLQLILISIWITLKGKWETRGKKI